MTQLDEAALYCSIFEHRFDRPLDATPQVCRCRSVTATWTPQAGRVLTYKAHPALTGVPQ